MIALFAWEVSFSPDGDLVDFMVKYIDSAQQYIYGAFYSWSDEAILQAFRRASERGVIIKLVMEGNTTDGSTVTTLNSAGVEVVTDGTSDALMHNKFLVIDGKILVVGSSNISVENLRYDNNNMIAFNNEELCSYYLQEFWEMWNGTFHGGKSYTDWVSLGNNIRAKPFFNPDNNIKKEVISAISEARREVLFAIYAFTDEDIAQALIEKATEGVLVVGVMDEDWTQSNPAAWAIFKDLVKAGINVVLDSNWFHTLHHKIIVIDRTLTITGSANFTPSAMAGESGGNDENSLFIESTEIANIYASEILRLYARPLPSTEEVKVPLRGYMEQNEGLKIHVMVSVPLVSLKVSVKTLDGGLISSKEISPVPGENIISIEGKTPSGASLSPGLLLVEVSGTDQNGKTYRNMFPAVIK